NYPDELSGGQMQRAAIARTLACDPEVILFDEPTSALDPTMVAEVECIIRQLADEGRTMMIVTHEMEFAKHVANRVFYMDQGGIYEDGTPEQIFEHPRKELTRRFIRQLSLLELTLEAGSTDFVSVVSDLEAFCEKNMVSRRTANRVALFLEELVFNTALPAMKPGEKLLAVLESTQRGQNVTVTVKEDAPGGTLTENILGGMDEISRRLTAYSASDFRMEDGKITASF
ncbi:MAG: ATP-binding cassette domain-containing protein, partial [Clostridia bacterium]|nr:ATP-binding cassette domain-containing protein [Clostridia bacterium]